MSPWGQDDFCGRKLPFPGGQSSRDAREGPPGRAVGGMGFPSPSPPQCCLTPGRLGEFPSTEQTLSGPPGQHQAPETAARGPRPRTRPLSLMLSVSDTRPGQANAGTEVTSDPTGRALRPLPSPQPSQGVPGPLGVWALWSFVPELQEPLPLLEMPPPPPLPPPAVRQGRLRVTLASARLP